MRFFDIRDRRAIRSVPEFLEDLFALRKNLKNRKLWYRGHSNEAYRLVPSIGRETVYTGKRVAYSAPQERDLLHRFRRRTYLEAGRLLKAGEALFVARHHGLPTRLLDWTANALFGLYFACYEQYDAEAQLWALDRFDDVVGLDALKLAEYSTETELFTALDARSSPRRRRIKLIEPLYNSARIRAQDGAFTVHSEPSTSIDEYARRRFRNADLDIHGLYKWQIAHKDKRRLIEQLSGLGITHRSVFPDLDGIARSLWETETLWRGR